MNHATAFAVIATVNTAIAVATSIGIFLYRKDKNAEALKTRMIAVLVGIAWLRFFIGLGYARPFASLAVGAGLVALTAFLLTPPQVKYLAPWINRRFFTEGSPPDA